MAKKIVKKDSGKPAKKEKKAAPVKKKAVVKAAAKKSGAKKAAVSKGTPKKAAPAAKPAGKVAGPAAAKKQKAPALAKAAVEASAAKRPSAGAKATDVHKAVPAAKRGKEKREDVQSFESEATEELEATPAEAEEAEIAAVDEESVDEIILTDAEGRRYCRVKDCDQLASVDGYCRFHYLLYWKRIQIRKKILSEGKLERYIEELTARYPDKFLDMLRKDLRSDKEFLAAIQELEIDESAVDNEFEDETATYIEEVRGMGEGGSGARDEEDF